jgi:hypothetical protein
MRLAGTSAGISLRSHAIALTVALRTDNDAHMPERQMHPPRTRTDVGARIRFGREARRNCEDMLRMASCERCGGHEVTTNNSISQALMCHGRPRRNC